MSKKAPLTTHLHNQLHCGSNFTIKNTPKSHTVTLKDIFGVIFRFCCSLVLAALASPPCVTVQCDKQPRSTAGTFLPRAASSIYREFDLRSSQAVTVQAAWAFALLWR